MKKRIVINLLNFSDAKIAGAGIFARNLMRAWFRQKGTHSIVILYSASVNVRSVFELTEFPGIEYKAVKVKSFIARILYEQILLPFRLKQFDVYFSPTPVMPLMSRFINRSMQHVVTIHDMIPFFVPEKYGRLRSVYVRWISIYGARLANNIITVSENSKKDICTLTGIPTSKVSVVYNFVPADLVKIASTHGRFFVSVSTIEPGKNIENTMLGFKHFLEKDGCGDFKFYWIGKVGWGYTQQSLDELIDRLELRGKFVLLGYVDNDRKAQLLSECAAMVYLSHYEGFGLPVLEAFQYDKPSVASRTSSLPEVVGEAGVLCDKENVEDIAHALAEVLTNSELYTNAISLQRKKFSEQSQLTRFLSVIESGGNE